MSTAQPFPLERIELYLKDKMYGKALPLLLRRYGTDVTIERITERDAPSNINAAIKDVYSIYSNRSPNPVPPPTNTEPDGTPPPSVDLDPSSPNVKFTARLLIGHALFTPTDDQFAGDFNDNTIVALIDLYPGDRFSITREDGVAKAWKVIAKETVGATNKVFSRYRVAAIES